MNINEPPHLCYPSGGPGLPHLPQAAPQGCREYRLCGLAGVCACGHLGGEVPLFVGGRELPVEGLGGEGGGRALLP